MKASPLRLDETFVGDVSIKSYEGVLPTLELNDLLIDATPSYARNIENPSQWIVKLSVAFRAAGEKPVSYEGHIKCEGHFTVADTDRTEEKQRRLVAVNAATILYSTAREVVATITARSRNGVFLLPSVSFIDQQITFPDDPVPEAPQPQPEQPASSVASAQ